LSGIIVLLSGQYVASDAFAASGRASLAFDMLINARGQQIDPPYARGRASESRRIAGGAR
jgi:hypothetical protein